MQSTLPIYKNRALLGFTFLEVLIATSIFAVVAGGIALFSFYYFQSYTFANEQNQQLFDAQSGLATMIKEIRSARQSEQGAWPIVEPNDQSLTFYSDVTGDGRADKVRYFIQNRILKKGVIQPTATAPIDYPATEKVIPNTATNIEMAPFLCIELKFIG
jgi:prepilin-type N-terminal cleavage/methylation domain-containing protein